MKNLLFLLSFLILLAPCAAQEKCGLTLRDAPVFFGFKLGMNPQQAQSVLGRDLKLKIKREGTFFQNFIDKPPPPFLPDVRALYLRFFDYKLYQIEIFYEKRSEKESGKQTLAEFVAALSANKNLPEKLWENSYGTLTLNCAEFSLVADDVLNPRIELTDEATRAEFEESQRRADKKKSR